MSAPRFLNLRGFSPRVVAFLMAMAMIAAGIGFPTATPAASAVESDDQRSDSQPCEESPEESSEDEESSAGKHTAILGVSFAIDPSAAIGYGVVAPSSRQHAGPLASATPIRGPPSAA